MTGMVCKGGMKYDITEGDVKWIDKEDKWGGEGQMRMGGGGRVQAPDEMYGEGWAWARMGRWWSG
jgi:hypothetical protein